MAKPIEELKMNTLRRGTDEFQNLYEMGSDLSDEMDKLEFYPYVDRAIHDRNLMKLKSLKSRFAVIPKLVRDELAEDAFCAFYDC